MAFDLKIHTPVDQLGIEERIIQLNSRSLKGNAKSSALRLALSMIDLTTLEGKDTEGKIKQLCQKALHPFADLPDLPQVAAVCVYPNHVKTAAQILAKSPIKVASVATAFPSGNTALNIKLADTTFAIEQGAQEIDMVINRGAFLQGAYQKVFDEIAAIKACCGQLTLKVILETGELGSLENVRKASEIAINAGADFIKTSTGKISPAATMPVTLVMLETIKDHHLKTGQMVGMKPAGGISTAKQALQYLVMLYETLGNAWLSPQYFRFGASSLANDIILQLGKEKYGHYYSKDYFAID